MDSPAYVFQLLVRHNGQLIPLEVEASCIEEACRTAKQILSGADGEQEEIDNQSAFRDAWLIMRTTPYEYCNKLHIYSWNGEHYKTLGTTEVGGTIFSAMQKIAPNLFWQMDASADMARMLSPANENIKSPCSLGTYPP